MACFPSRFVRRVRAGKRSLQTPATIPRAMPDKKTDNQLFNLIVVLIVAAILFGVYWFREDFLYLIRMTTH